MGGLASGITASNRAGSGWSARRWTRKTISISMAGCSSRASSMYQRRYDVWLHVGQSKVMWATTRGGRPSPGSP